MQKELFIFSLACAASCASADSLFPRSTCSNFSSDGDPFTQPGPSSFIVSAGVVCTDSRGCPVPAGGFVTVERTLNLNSSSETANAIFDLITSVVDIPFNASSTADTTHGTWTLDAGSSGYVAFTPNFRCVKGALSGCTGENIQDGTSVQACAPYTLAGQTQGLDGTSRLVQTDEATARAVTCNPANTTNPAGAPDQSCLSSGSSPESAASSVSLLGKGSVLAAAALTLLWTGSLI